MFQTLLQRTVARVDSPGITTGLSAAHRVRSLIPPGNWAETDPFLLLMEDWFPVGVFDRHPHRGFETVTYVIDGDIVHYDNHGHEGTIGPGDAQWLTTGRGLIHNEQPTEGGVAHILQLWINLPSADKLVKAHHQELKSSSLPVRREQGVEIRVFSGTSGSTTGPAYNHVPVLMVEVRLAPNTTVQQVIPDDFNAFIVGLEGVGLVGAPSTGVSKGQIAWLTHATVDSEVTLSSGDNGFKAMLFAGLPLREPVATRGPFVMNTEEQLMEGFSEYWKEGDQFGL